MQEQTAANDVDEGLHLAQEEEELRHQRARDLELAKFKANAWDRLSTQLVTVAIFTPLIGVLYKVASFAMLSRLEIAFGIVACLVGALILHLFGQSVLQKGFER